MYATKLPSRNIAVPIAIAAVTGVGVYAVQYSSTITRTVLAETNEPPMPFAGKFAYASLPLHSVKAVNHNTKRLLFALPNQDARSGLKLTCMAPFNAIPI